MPTELPNKPKIAFDTNMLLAIGQLHVDIISEARKLFGGNAVFTIPKQVLQELKDLEKGDKKMSKAVKIALREIENKIEITDKEASNADQALAKMAKEGYTIATNDSALRKRIKGFGGKVIYLRQRRFLKMD